jgi:hypothetical protein
MNKWKPGSLPNSIKEYGYNHPIWTDIDLAKAFAFGMLVGILLGIVL